MAVLAMAALVVASAAGCGAEPPSSEPASPPVAFPTVPPTPLSPARQLLATLPTEAGGMLFNSYEIVDDSLNVGHPVDHVLTAIGKERADAVSVFRWSEDTTIGAIAVDGIDGGTLLEAFVEAWQAPAVIRRWPRPAAGSIGWGLEERGGAVTVVYRRASVIYLVTAPTRDPAKLAEILADMPPGGDT